MALPMKMLIRDLEVEVTVEPSRDGMSAYFTANVNGNRHVAKTWNDLYKTLMTETKRAKVRVRVPYLQLIRNGSDWSFESHVAVGIHGGSNNIEVESPERLGRPQPPRQVDSYTIAVYDVGLTDDEKRERVSLAIQQKNLQAKIDTFDGAHTFRLRDAVRDAIEEVVQAPDEAAS